MMRVQLLEKEKELEREQESKEERQKYYMNKEQEWVSQIEKMEHVIAQLEDQSQKDREQSKLDYDDLTHQLDLERK